MARGRAATVLAHRVVGGDGRRAPHRVTVEEPPEVQLAGALVATTMRTPAPDFERAAGLSCTDGRRGGAPVRQVRYCATGSAVDTEFNVVTVQTGGLAPEPRPRLTSTTSSCGLCGSVSIQELRERIGPLT